MTFARFILSASIVAFFALHSACAVEPPLINCADLLQQPIGPLGFEVSPFTKSLHAQNVRLRGYMVKSEEDARGHFYFASLPLQISEHADGPANDLPASTVLVKLDPSRANWTIPHQSGSLVLEGTLIVERHEDAQGVVSWFQLQLPIH